jgi:membrane-bound lytic murein transglycosylase B
MIRKFMARFYKILAFTLLFQYISVLIPLYSFSDETFESWLITYKKFVLKKGISQKTVDTVFSNVRFLEQVIRYDRKQPEFFEDTITYVSKRANSSRVKNARKLLSKNKSLFNEVENKFFVEKEILLALWGIETNFGKHVGKMDIISSLATLSYDKRRRDFFSSQLLILLQLVDDNLIDPKTLYGSWAGAYGNFQFMPSSIKRYAIDYDNNNKIELKTSLHDALASAANYINSIGWKKNQPCFFRVKLLKDIKKKYINSDARTISNRLEIKKWKKKGIVNYDGTSLETNLKAALILPDGKIDSPAYLVFENYEKILKWNRSLRFGISVCTLANKIKI